MLEQARKRNAKAIAAGRVSLQLASTDAIPKFAEPFDKVLAVNVFQFLNDPVHVLCEIRAAMEPRGTIALTVEPRNRNATDDDALRAGERMTTDLRIAGFTDVRLEVLELEPVSAACALARKPA
jgi:trans-aconitate methyltransferase